MRAKRAIIVSQKTGHNARLAQIPSASLRTGSSLRNKRLLRMTIKLTGFFGLALGPQLEPE
jgi:hypothetical protein